MNIETHTKYSSCGKTSQKDNNDKTPHWIPVTSWVIGGTPALVVCLAIINDSSMDYPYPKNIIWGIIWGGLIGLIFKSVSYMIFFALYNTGKMAVKGIVAASKEGSKLINIATTEISQQIDKVNKEKIATKLELEKQKINIQNTTKKLQRLEKHIQELDQQIQNK